MICEYDIRMNSPTSVITQFRGDINALFSTREHTILYSASRSSSNSIFNFADVGGMWTGTGNWNQADEKSAFWTAATGLCMGGKTFLGMAGNSGVTLIEAMEQNMRWDCK